MRNKPLFEDYCYVNEDRLYNTMMSTGVFAFDIQSIIDVGSAASLWSLGSKTGVIIAPLGLGELQLSCKVSLAFA